MTSTHRRVGRPRNNPLAPADSLVEIVAAIGATMIVVTLVLGAV